MNEYNLENEPKIESKTEAIVNGIGNQTEGESELKADNIFNTETENELPVEETVEASPVEAIPVEAIPSADADPTVEATG